MFQRSNCPFLLDSSDKNIQIEDCSCAAPDHARHEPTPSQTKLHVAQRVRPARKNIILAKKTSKNVDF